MKLKFKPRFFIITGGVSVGLFLLSTNVLLKKRIDIKIVDNEKKGSVLAETTQGKNSSDSYALLESDNEVKKTSDETRKQKSAEEDLVTISHTVSKGDTITSVAERYHADPQTIIDYPYNNIGDDLNLKPGQILIIPYGYIDGQQAPAMPEIPIGTGQFMWPVHGIITQYMSWFHPGAIDIAIPLKTPIAAADNGTVIAVEHFTTGYGNHVIIDHGNGLTSLYAHMTQTLAVKGQIVRKGDVVGLSGSTGRSTGPHLHFEVRRDNKGINPLSLLPPIPKQ